MSAPESPASPAPGPSAPVSSAAARAARATSARALGRSYGAERVLTLLAGLLVLAGGVLALVVGFGWLGRFRAQRPVLDPLAVQWLGRQPVPAKIAAIVLGLLLLGFGLWWFFRSLRPERRPDLELEHPPAALTVTAEAIAGAVRADAETVDGVSRARVRSVGDAAAPALRLSLWLREDADLRLVWAELDQRVLARARDSLGMDVLPVAVRIELDTAQRQRVR